MSEATESTIRMSKDKYPSVGFDNMKSLVTLTKAGFMEWYKTRLELVEK